MMDLNDVDGPLQDIKYMAEIASDLSDNFSTDGAQPGFFQIQRQSTGLLL
jgi:hypothetical protein